MKEIPENKESSNKNSSDFVIVYLLPNRISRIIFSPRFNFGISFALGFMGIFITPLKNSSLCRMSNESPKLQSSKEYFFSLFFLKDRNQLSDGNFLFEQSIEQSFWRE